MNFICIFETITLMVYFSTDKILGFQSLFKGKQIFKHISFLYRYSYKFTYLLTLLMLISLKSPTKTAFSLTLWSIYDFLGSIFINIQTFYDIYKSEMF